jgi:tRNA (cytidine/uridine-2'-O-)-methyltransferase
LFELILYQPEIPPNTGNIIRLCANTGARLHVIRPLGFELDDKQLRRAGLDYHEFADIQSYDSLDECLQALNQPRVFAISTRGTTDYTAVSYQPGDAIILGPETRGLPQQLLDELPAERRLRIPMRPDNRSLNLSNAAAILVYEAWRQQGFEGGN